MNRDGLEIRRHTQRQKLSKKPVRMTPHQRQQLRNSMMPDKDITDVTTEDDLVDEVFAKSEAVDVKPRKTAKAAKADDEPKQEVLVKEDMDVSVAEDEEEFVMSIVESVTLAGETFRSFMMMIDFMDTQLHERRIAYEKYAAMMKPDNEDS
jgi:hypothetical protein